MNRLRVRRAGALTAMASFALMVLAACGGGENLEAEREDVTRVPTMSDAAAQATREAPSEASPEAGGGTPASGEATPVAAGETAATPVGAATPIGAPAASPAATPVEQASVPATTAATPEPAAEPAAAAETVEVVSIDIAFEPAEVTIPADTDVTFVLPNEGVTAHNFSIDALNISVDQAPGATQEIVITAPAGTYEYYCNVPGHKAAGMAGALTVE